MRALETPDVTKNQVTALVIGISGVLASVGLPLSDANQNRLFVGALVISSALKLSDAAIRVGRALMAGKKIDNLDLGLDESE